MDGGWGWCVLLATFTMQLIYAGAVPNVGIYLVELQEYFGVGPAAVSFIATELTFGVAVTGIFSGALCQRFGCRLVMIFGGCIGALSTLLSAFATQLWHLHILSTIAGMGYGIAFFPSIVVIRFYFKKRLGMANGFTYAGIGAGFFVMAPVVEALCSTYGWSGALMVHAAINANILVCGIVLRRTKMEQKIMKAYRSTDPPELDTDEAPSQSGCERILKTIDDTFALSKLVRNYRFIIYCCVCIFTFGGYIAVLVYTSPRLVQDLGFATSTASLVMSVYGISSLSTRLLHGFLLDFKLITVTNLYLVSLVICGIQPMFSPFVTSSAGHFAMVVVHGIGAGVMIPMSILVCREFVPVNIASNAIGLFLAVGGLGNLLGTQLMGQLCDATGSYDIPFYVSGAFFWISAIVMTLVSKCFKSNSNSGDEFAGETTVAQEEGMPSPDQDSLSDRSKYGRSGYQPVPDVDDVGYVIEEDSKV